jgi:putative transposase
VIVERTPVAAKVVEDAPDWHWSSARSHGVGKRVMGDRLTDVQALGRYVPNWRAMSRHGLETGELSPEGEGRAQAIEGRLSTARTRAALEWIAEQEPVTSRQLA